VSYNYVIMILMDRNMNSGPSQEEFWKVRVQNSIEVNRDQINLIPGRRDDLSVSFQDIDALWEGDQNGNLVPYQGSN